MKPVIVAALLTALSCAPVLADWDPESEAREQAERDAEQKASQAEQRQINEMKAAAQAKYDKEVMIEKRKTLGAAAKGNSDAEVTRLYEAKIKSDTAAAQKAHQAGRQALSQGQGAEALRQVTGKSLAEMENMSEEEAEALSREMERKYGQ